MWRALSAMLLVLMLCQATGAGFPAEPDGCADACPGEESGSRCQPDCALCACCPGAPPLLLTPAAGPAAPERLGACGLRSAAITLTRPPHEILHVPRSRA